MAAGSFNWRALATSTASDSVTGLGESPYFPTLRGPHRKGSSGSSAGAGVTDATCALPINTATCDKDKGKREGLLLCMYNRHWVLGSLVVDQVPRHTLATNTSNTLSLHPTGFYGTCDRDTEALPSDETLLVGPADGSAGENGAAIHITAY